MKLRDLFLSLHETSPSAYVLDPILSCFPGSWHCSFLHYTWANECQSVSDEVFDLKVNLSLVNLLRLKVSHMISMLLTSNHVSLPLAKHSVSLKGLHFSSLYHFSKICFYPTRCSGYKPRLCILDSSFSFLP